MNTPPPYDVAFSFRAGRDMREIRRYLKEKASEQVAQKVILGLFEAIETLQEQPEPYPQEPLLVEHGNYRVIRKGAYDIFYEFTGHDIYIYRIVHSKRDLQRIFKRFNIVRGSVMASISRVSAKQVLSPAGRHGARGSGCLPPGDNQLLIYPQKVNRL